ncbi:GNAT family N-acetyltransferase [Methylobacterium sp. E-041]|uniref:GNAT family N-acetyltransferase n=1 Tax=Methylobacterium sp. E-041 TaxID=2836573 RepID=UPI001FB8D861|nr:GNAT family N-acetyltransferase [Methylobacterium sp. E-041]MCJ2105956.1 GNAT family N-acetyltransferase [Methylobacterium sp. E-041]
MPQDVLIRPVARADHAQWLPLWEGYNLFYERVGPAAIPPAVTQANWERFFDAYEPMHALVAEREGRLIGLTHYLYHRTTTATAPFCYLQDLFTTADARGRGVGRALIEAVYVAARRAGSPRVYWQTHETNATAMRLYDQVGDRSGFVVYRKSL